MKSRARFRFASLLVAIVVLVAVVAVVVVVQGRASPSGRYQTVQVKRGNIETVVTALGTLQPRSYVDVGAQVSGQITALRVDAGSVVKKGDLLVEIDPRVPQAVVDAGRAALASLNAQLQDQQAQHELAGLQLARQRQMAADGVTRQEDLDIAEATLKSANARLGALKAQIAQTESTLKGDEAQLEFTRVYSPMDGTVISVDVKQGQTLNATYQTPTLLRVADLASMTVWSEVSEADVRRVKAGMSVNFTTLGADQRRWHGTVRQVLPAPPTRAGQTGGENESAQSGGGSKVVVYTVLFDVENGDGELMPQMTAQVSFVAAAANEVLVAPLQALTAVDGKPGRYSARVLDGDDDITLREVDVGMLDRLNAEVKNGLADGDRLIVGELDPPTSRWNFTL